MLGLKKIGITLLFISLIHTGFANTTHKRVKKITHHHTHHKINKNPKTNKHHKKSHHKPVHKKKSSSIRKFTPKKNKRTLTKHVIHKPAPPIVVKSLFTSMEKTLVNFVRNTIESIRYTAYKLGGTRIDRSRGIYVVDCSSYVDHILKTIYPRAYTSLTRWSGTQKPTTNDYYHYFRNLSYDSTHWNSVNDVEQLRPGDILVFRNKNRFGTETGGHVMVVMDKPERNRNTFLVRIADSAPVGHSKDTRMPHASGIGIGTMVLKVNPHTSLPNAYAWRVGSPWKNNVKFAMARPVNSKQKSIRT